MADLERTLAVERTALAWQRTALAVALNAALVLRLAAEREQAWLWACGGALGVASLVLGSAASQRYRGLRGRAAPAVLLPVRRVGPALVLLVLAVSLIGAAAALAPSP